MNELQAFFESEVIEAYCLGVASPVQINMLFEYCEKYPAVRGQLEATKQAMESAISSHQKLPSSDSKNIIRQSILENQKLARARFNGSNYQLTEFFEISRHTNFEQLQNLLKDFTPPDEFENIYAIPLYADDEKEAVLVWAKKIVPEELHEHLDERFLILEGKVDCYVEDEVFPMRAGDFMKIPPYSDHKVVITSSTPAKAIRTRVRITQ